ncbi:protein of unknown function [Methanoculleus bourgensis]|uniref:Uncharacterized protein n=2 Tax=Methanoculleus bourgensis TaxID=83986 RepID=A0A0X3BJZ4_9EURY|nr:protein of unknown function [Methanoculleus bourgensis]
MSDGLIFHPFLKCGKVLNALYNLRKDDGADPTELSKINCECQVFCMGYPENPRKSDVFKESDYAYLKERVRDVKNPLLKSRYAHLLVHCDIPDKYRYAEVAVQEYLKLLRIYEEKREGISGHWVTTLEWATKNALNLSVQFNMKTCKDEVKNEIKRLVFQKSDEDPQYSFLIIALVNQMLDQKQIFHKDDFENIDEILIGYAFFLRQSGKNFPRKAIELYELGSKIERKFCTTKHNWDLYIAENHEELCKTFENNAFVALEECQDAIMHYKLAKMPEKVKEMEQKYGELKKKISIPRHQVEIQDDGYKKYLEGCKKFVQDLIEKEPETIIGCLVSSPDLIPDMNKVRDGSEVYLRESVTHQLFNTTLVDTHGNTAQTYDNGEEKEKYAQNTIYRIALENYTCRLVHAIIIEAAKKGKLTPQNVCEYLQHRSWLGQPIQYHIPSGGEFEVKWLDLIEPAIHSYLNALQDFVESEKTPNFILSLDSLTLKFEGIFRAFCALHGISPTKQITERGKTLTREKDLNNLLYDDYDEVSKILGVNEIEFFRFVFVEQSGLNLRNNIAHCLLFKEQYYVYFADLVFLAILRISRGMLFDVKEEGVSEDLESTVDEKDSVDDAP